MQTEHFVYGAGEDAVTLEALVPVWTCSECNDAYVGGEAEELRHEAVCIHLGRPTANDLREFRRKRGLTQQQFAELGGFGIASIKRWEGSEQVPSASSAAGLRKILSSKLGRPTSEPKFRTTFTQLAVRRAMTFRPGFGSPPSELRAI